MRGVTPPPSGGTDRPLPASLAPGGRYARRRVLAHVPGAQGRREDRRGWAVEPPGGRARGGRTDRPRRLPAAPVLSDPPRGRRGPHPVVSAAPDGSDRLQPDAGRPA